MRSSFSLRSLPVSNKLVECITNHDATVHYLITYKSMLISSELLDLIQESWKSFFFFALSSLNLNSLCVRLKAVFHFPACFSACVCSPWISHIKPFIASSRHHFTTFKPITAAQPLKRSSNYEFVIQTAYRIKKCSSGWNLGPKLPVCITSAL